MSVLITETIDLNSATEQEKALAPGLYEARFYINNPVSSVDIRDARLYLKEQGVDVKSVYQKKVGGLWYVGVKYVIHPPSESISFLPVAVIPLIGFALVSVLVGVGIFKIESLTNNIGKILLITLGGTIVIAALLRKPIEHATAAAVKKYV